MSKALAVLATASQLTLLKAVTALIAVTAFLYPPELLAQIGVPAPTEYAKQSICIAELSQPLTVELADNWQQRARGLMQRESLADNAGMWFRYNEKRPGNSGFWMYQTLLPLDIAFFDQQQRIVSIITMPPCASEDPGQCPSYAPGHDYYSALETNAGFFSAHGITVGDKLYTESHGDCELPNKN
ncbi:DUF192 domain-containing protein [Idiomarina xiamenensis]|uniref:DUF192 domain-containing protein n=1 Tax=Idiomarina xiamenensis 10-D-4 TaxID=740709 RepID=K2JMJ0_9GAMM|nr:DUF192 domain-containing protein [Idiomarina xiamenensis]EKE84726.1 hypothetical protein A10D4_03910 [Idiomarina xiamenensis 10-D-4]